MQKSDFKKIDPSFYPVYRSFAGTFFPESCERSWANLLLYMHTYDWHAAVINDNLWIASFRENYIFFPLGRMIEPAVLSTVLKEFCNLCGTGECTLGDVPEKYPQFCAGASELMIFENDPGEADYIYDLQHLQSFSGSKLRKRHNQVRQFEREYIDNWSCRNICSADLPEICRFAERLSCSYWTADSGAEEKLAFELLPDIWQMPEAGLAGIALYVGNVLAGFSIYSALSDSVADIHFEKADHLFCGCGAKLTALAVEDLLQKNFKFMNREQDLNDEGLRRAKRALDPAYLYCRLSAKLAK